MSVKNLESRLVLTADPTQMISGIRKAERELSSINRTARAFAGGFVANLGFGTITNALRFFSDEFDKMRTLAHSYSGIAASANAKADNAELMRDVEIAKAAGPRIAAYEAARQRMAMYEQSQYAGAVMPVSGTDMAMLSGGATASAGSYAASRLGSPSAGMNVMNPGAGFVWDFVSSLTGQANAVSEDTETLKAILDEQRKANATGGGG